MIGIRRLSHDRLELYASRFPLDTLRPFLLEAYGHAYATIVLYEDNPEVYHETGIFSFDASEPETFNYEEFQAPLIEEFHDRVAVCTVENLFQHLDNYMDARPMDDDPFQNLVFSISLVPPSRELLMDWDRNIDQRLRRVLYDDESDEHFHLFPEEVCVVYSHDNHFTSVTSSNTELLRAVFDDVVEGQLATICPPPLPENVLATLYHQLHDIRSLRLKTDRIQTDNEGRAFIMVTYPRRSSNGNKRLAKIMLDDEGRPTEVTEPNWIPRLQYHLRYSDLSLVPMALTLIVMLFLVVMALYFRPVFGRATTSYNYPASEAVSCFS